MPTTQEYFTVSEVADRLHVSERLVRRLIASGELRAVKIGSRVIRITDGDLAQFVRPAVGSRSGAEQTPPAARGSELGIGRRVVRRAR